MRRKLVGVLDLVEAFLFNCGYDLTIFDENSSAIVRKGLGSPHGF